MNEDKVKRFITELKIDRNNHRECAKYGSGNQSIYHHGYAEALLHVIERVKVYFLSNNTKE